MKKLLLLVNMLLLHRLSCGQSLGLSAVASGHGEGNSGAVHLEWSIGEVAVHTLEAGSNVLSQGFLQPDASYVFPVKLIYFNGKTAGNHNELLWATSEETNNSHFEVQKSPDGIRFQLMEQISGAGTVYTQKTYGAIDQSPYTHTYYRLKQVDHDGTFSFSSIIHIRQTDHPGFALHPNPTADMLYLSVGKSNGPLHITVLDTRGHIVLRQPADPGDHISLSTRLLLPGTYVVQILGSFALPLWSSRFVKL